VVTKQLSPIRSPDALSYLEKTGLVILLGMIMFNVFVQRPAQGALTKENHLGQALHLHRTDPALRIGIKFGQRAASVSGSTDLTQ
jgi:hypothetical protein